MMTESVDLDRIATDIRAVAKECGALIVEAALPLETKAPVVAVASADFPDLIRHVRPKLVYLLVASFDAEEGTREVLEREDDNPIELPRITKFSSKWRSRNGKTFRVAVGVMCEGILHWLVEDTDWFAEFETEAEALKQELDEAREEREEKSREQSERALAVERREQFAPLIKQLIADPRFSGPKVGVAKRTVLAQTLFPDLDNGTIRAIVEQAENDHWLASSG